MNPKELRIGNYLVNGEVSSIAEASVLNHCDELYLYDELEPIELTEQWLFKFGFKEYPLDWLVYDKMSVCFYKGKLKITFQNAALLLDIKYVHELQNLYFTLTREELSIK